VANFGLRLPNPVGLVTDTVLGADVPSAPALTISELTGSQRSVTLRGRALPYRPVAWSARMRTKLTWYQGNPVATQQVLGPELAPTTLQGTWKDRFMYGAEAGNDGAIVVNGDPTEIRSAEAAVALMYELLQSGNRLRVIWGQEVREGVLVEFEANYDRQQDIQWRAEFEWASRGDGERRQLETPQGPDDLLKAQNALDDFLGFVSEDMARAFNAQLLDTVDSVRESVGVAFGALRTLNTVVATPSSVVGAVSQAAGSIRRELTEEIGRLTESSAVGARAGASVTARAASLMVVESDRRTAARRAADVRATVLALDRQVQARAVPEQVRVVPVPADTSLYTLSSRYYGSPDFAGFLARVNGLDTALAPAGFQLRVPPRPVVDDAGNGSC